MPQEKKILYIFMGKNNTEIAFPVDLPEQKPTSLVILRQVRIYSNTCPESRQPTPEREPQNPLLKDPSPVSQKYFSRRRHCLTRPSMVLSIESEQL